MKVEKVRVVRVFEPISVKLETPDEVKKLYQLTGDGLYDALKHMYGEEVASKIVDFKTVLNSKLKAFVEPDC